jgi:hypothetical protein
MARPAPAFLPHCILMSAALALGSCQNLPSSFDSSGGQMPPQQVSGTAASGLPAVLISHSTQGDYSQLEAENVRLKNQLAGALKENAKLKKDLANAIDDKALLKDLAAKKQR